MSWYLDRCTILKSKGTGIGGCTGEFDGDAPGPDYEEPECPTGPASKACLDVLSYRIHSWYQDGLSNEVPDAELEDLLLKTTNSNSAYKTASKHVKFHATPKTVKATPKAGGKAKAKAKSAGRQR